MSDAVNKMRSALAVRCDCQACSDFRERAIFAVVAEVASLENALQRSDTIVAAYEERGLSLKVDLKRWSIYLDPTWIADALLRYRAREKKRDNRT